MSVKNNQSFRRVRRRIFNLLTLIFISLAEISAQGRKVTPAAQGENSAWWYVSIFVLALGLAAAILWWLNTKNAQKDSTPKISSAKNDKKKANSLDAAKDFEQLRKSQNLVGKNTLPTAAEKYPNSLSETEAQAEKDFSALPIFSFQKLKVAEPLDALPVSGDEDLLMAVEQASDEFEEDEEARHLAIRILAAYKNSNAVEALAQIALHDASAGLRSKAVTALSEFDHESVFEPILLAGADSSREVRAAAVSGLTKLTFNRADAWRRIAETGDDRRIARAARAATESGLVDTAFERLVHPDRQYAYEAFALTALLIEAGGTEKILNALETHRDINVRRAILRVIKVTRDQRTLDALCTLLEKNTLPVDFQKEVDRTIEEIGFVAA
jgi:HEAT repeat protein